MPGIPHRWKVRIARLVRYPLLHWLMIFAVRLLVPRQRIGVAAVALNENGDVLLLKHVFHPAAPWGLPGGWLGRNESPDQGALRELKEETGLTAELDRLVYLSHESSPPHLEIAFLVRVSPGEVRLSGEILEARWFPIDQLPVPLLPSTRRIIESAVAEAGRENNRLYE